MYFVHGRSNVYNYNVCAYMFANGSEIATVEDGEIVRLRLFDEDDDYDDDDGDQFVPLYARDLAVPLTKAMRLLVCRKRRARRKQISSNKRRR